MRRFGPNGAVLAPVLVSAVLVPAVVASGGAAGSAVGRPAHTTLVSSQPAHGETLPESPEEIVLELSDEVDVVAEPVRLYDHDGADVPVGEARADGVEVTVPVSPLGDGTYVVVWRVTALDGHPVSGSFWFRVGDASAAAGPIGTGAEQASERAVVPAPAVTNLEGGGAGQRILDVASPVVQFCVFIAVILLVGGALFVSWVWPQGATSPRVRRIIFLGWLLMAVGTAAAVGLRAVAGAGGSLTGAARVDALTAVIQSHAGRAWLARLGLLVVVAVAWRHLFPAFWKGATARAERAAPHWLTVVIIGLGLLTTVSVTGHAASGDLVPVALVVDVVHLGAVALWLGGLTILFLVVLRVGPGGRAAGRWGRQRHQPKHLRVARQMARHAMGPAYPLCTGTGQPRQGAHHTVEQVVRRFSVVASGAVVVIVVTGLFQSWRHLRSAAAVTETTFGRSLVLKLGLVTLVLVVAGASRWAVRRWEGLGTASRLRRAVLAEAVLALAVLGVTSVLVNASPGGEQQPEPSLGQPSHGVSVLEHQGQVGAGPGDP